MKYKSVSKCLILQLNSSSTPHISFWTVLQQSHCTVLSYEVIFKSFVFFYVKLLTGSQGCSQTLCIFASYLCYDDAFLQVYLSLKM